MAEVPAWASELVVLTCAEAGVAPPRLAWRIRERVASSGVTRRGTGSISVVAGTDVLDQRITLLHELAHWLTLPAVRARRGRVPHHDASFYRAAFALYARHGVRADTALAAEGARYPSSLGHARALGVEGAEQAWQVHRARLRERARERSPLRVLIPEHRVRLVRDGRWTRCSVCGVRVVGPVLRRLRRRGGRHVLLSRA